VGREIPKLNIVWDSDNLGPFAFKVGIFLQRSQFKIGDLDRTI
jgi:hypothetical protein